MSTALFMTHSGILFDYLAPEKEEQYCIKDIAHHLATIQRFNGALRHNITYSVGEHCINIARFMLTEGYAASACLVALLHDASEAYLGDLPSPLKILLPDYKKIESKIQKVILKKYCGQDFIPDFVKVRDEIALEAEVAQLLDSHCAVKWPNGFKHGNQGMEVTHSNPPRAVARSFLKLYEELSKNE